MKIIVACMMASFGAVHAEPKTESKPATAKLVVKKYAYEAFPQWAVEHPDKACPDRLAHLAAYIHRKDDKDPWGRPYRMFCGDNLPKDVKGFGVVSLGEDGKLGTADDIKSWD